MIYQKYCRLGESNKDWLIETKFFDWMAKKQLDVKLFFNQSFL